MLRKYDLIEDLRERLSVAARTELNVGLNRHLPNEYEQKSRQQSGVLILIKKDGDDMSVFFTQRSMNISHPGTWCFPGGRLEEQDNYSLINTALREGQEEAGIPIDQLDVLGTLTPCHDRNHSLVTPVIAVIDSPFTPVLSLDEVMDSTEIPLQDVLNIENHKTISTRHNGDFVLYRQFAHERPGQDTVYIRGLTGGILNYFRHFTNKERGPLDYGHELP